MARGKLILICLVPAFLAGFAALKMDKDGMEPFIGRWMDGFARAGHAKPAALPEGDRQSSFPLAEAAYGVSQEVRLAALERLRRDAAEIQARLESAKRELAALEAQIDAWNLAGTVAAATASRDGAAPRPAPRRQQLASLSKSLDAPVPARQRLPVAKPETEAAMSAIASERSAIDGVDQGAASDPVAAPAVTAAPALSAPTAPPPTAAPVVSKPAEPAVAPPAVKPEKDEPDRAEIVRRLQTRLERANCDPGPIDGLWGRRTRSALERFVSAGKFDVPTNEPTIAAMTAVEDRRDFSCPLQCGSDQIKSGGRCIDRPRPQPVSAPAPKPTYTPPPEPDKTWMKNVFRNG